MTRFPLTIAAALLGVVGAALVSAWLLFPRAVVYEPAPLASAPPGGPIVVVTDRTAPGLDAYLTEVLRAEGWTSFSTRDVTEVSSQTLPGARLVVLGWSARISTELAATLDTFVRSGGALICLRPRPELHVLSGVNRGQEGQRYVALPTEDAGSAITQVFGETETLTPIDDTQVVTAFVGQAGEQNGAAITIHRHGKGRVATFGFDPARTIAYLRQGDPSWRGEERDGAPGARATDAFAGWIELTRMNRPQADDHLHVISTVIDALLADGGGEPRLWYLPGGEPAALVVTADAHATTTAAVQAGLDLVEHAGGRMTVYYDPPAAPNRLRRTASRTLRQVRSWWSPPESSAPTAQIVRGWRTRGHEFSVHPVVEPRDLEGSYRRAVEAFSDEGFGPPSTTVRTHAVYWQGPTVSAATESGLGFGLTLDYYHSGPWLRRPDGGWVHTNFTGSFLPMRLVRDDGNVFGIRQLTTSMADEQLIAYAYDGWEHLDADGATEVTREVLRRAMSAGGVPVLQFHLDFLEPGHPLRSTISRWVAQSLEFARTLGMPIWSASHLLEFERCREQTRVVGTRWSSSAQLTFEVVQSGTLSCGVGVVLPSGAGVTDSITVTIDGRAAADAVVRRGGKQVVTLPPGNHAVDVTFATPLAASRQPSS